jgi:hypothetical protein
MAILWPALACAVIGGAVCLSGIPLAIWHKVGSDGQEHPDTATWIAYGISAALVLAGLMYVSIRAARRRPA